MNEEEVDHPRRRFLRVLLLGGGAALVAAPSAAEADSEVLDGGAP